MGLFDLKNAFNKIKHILIKNNIFSPTKQCTVQKTQQTCLYQSPNFFAIFTPGFSDSESNHY